MAEASRDRRGEGGGEGARLMVNCDEKMTYTLACPERQQIAYAGKFAECVNTHKGC